MEKTIESENATSLRKSILRTKTFVDLISLVATCWSIGVPVLHLGRTPLDNKSMSAMVVRESNRFVILLATNWNYPAQAAFALAHEIGHIFLGHLQRDRAIVDLEENINLTHSGEIDEQETQADEFAKELIYGTRNLRFEFDRNKLSAPALADAVLKKSVTERIEPGALSLAFAYEHGTWSRSMSALKFIYTERIPVCSVVNSIANSQLNWDLVSDDTLSYLQKIMECSDG